jgi:NADP-dependent 3-hydroxy acid dehydrogenase YdfG
MTASTATNGAVAPVAFITGTSSGFGYELARQALARGIRVIATARKLSDMAELEKLGAKTLRLDVSAPAGELAAIVKEAIAV